MRGVGENAAWDGNAGRKRKNLGIVAAVTEVVVGDDAWNVGDTRVEVGTGAAGDVAGVGIGDDVTSIDHRRPHRRLRNS